MENEEKARIKTAAHEYANPKTKVIQSYTRLFDAFESGAKWAHESQSKTIEQLKADNFFLENEKDGLIQENKKLRETFCSC